MKIALQLANRFREVTLNGTWIANTNVQDQLKDVDLDVALTQIYNLNTIAKLTFHINYYIAGVLQVFEGEELTIRDKYSFDVPDMNSEQEWQALKEQLFSNSEKFAQHVEKMSDDTLDTFFVKQEYGTYRRNIDGMIEHCYYHLGQITLIKKMIKSSGTDN